MSDTAIIIGTIAWGIAIVLYYFAGKQHGYAKGYADGVKQGHANVLSALNASGEFLTETKT